MSNRMDIIKRDDESFELTFVDIEGNPINLLDCTVFFTVKKRVTDTDEHAIIAKEITYFAAPTSGVAILDLTHEETDLHPGSYFFDVQVKDTRGDISSSEVGRLLVKQDITIRTTGDDNSQLHQDKIYDSITTEL